MFAPNQHHYDLVKMEQAHQRSRAARERMALATTRVSGGPVSIRTHRRRLAAAAFSLALAIGIAGGVAAAANQLDQPAPAVDAASGASVTGGGATLIR